jgi:hypothetical protein
VQSATKSERYLTYLRDEGYVPRLDDDGDVVFKYEGRGFALYGDEHDAALFRLVHPFIWQVQSEEEQDLARDVMNDLNTRFHVVKFYQARGHIWASVELFLDRDDAFATVFPRVLRLLTQAVTQFALRMKPDEEWTV